MILIMYYSVKMDLEAPLILLLLPPQLIDGHVSGVSSPQICLPGGGACWGAVVGGEGESCSPQCGSEPCGIHV